MTPNDRHRLILKLSRHVFSKYKTLLKATEKDSTVNAEKFNKYCKELTMLSDLVLKAGAIDNQISKYEK